MTAAHLLSTLFEEIAMLFASAPSAKAILGVRSSPAAVDCASELLEFNQANSLDDVSCAQLGQYE